MNVLLIGCGGWGARIAHRIKLGVPGIRLAAVMDDNHAHAQRLHEQCELDGVASRVDDLAAYLDVMRPDGVILATPPDTRREYIAKVCAAKIRRLRVEKPLGITADEASEYAAMCAEAGVTLTTGFNLLHDPLYEFALEYLRQNHPIVWEFGALRVSAPPRHRAHPMLDIGIHAASIAAHARVSAERVHITAMHVPGCNTRITRLGPLLVDEITRTVETPIGVVRVANHPDNLGRCLEAWANGTHRGTPDVAIRAHEIIDWTIAVTNTTEAA